VCACFAAAIQNSPALAAQVIANDFIQLRDVVPSEFTVGTGTESLSVAFARFNYSGRSVNLVSRSADLQYYRVVNFGDVFNPLDPRVEMGLADGGLGDVGSGDFYLGIWLPVGDSTGFENFGQRYGWIHLRPANGILTMVGNAMSFDSRGIIVGTLETVPEPTSGAVLPIALAALICKLRITRQ
jgi:hypothetical protein